ncbi:MAG: transcription termination factor Rho [Phycisphaerales bacterium]|nr:transcription termination factor Rho [Phycisphaerales bacterium]
MTTFSGLVDQPRRGDVRLRPIVGDTVQFREDDPILPRSIVDRFALLPGTSVEVELGSKVAGVQQNGKGRNSRNGRGRRGRQSGRQGENSVKAPVAERLLTIEGIAADDAPEPTPFDELTTVDPSPRMTLEYPGCAASCRLVDLFCPIGFGQRAMVVSPPKAGKTTLLKDIATAILRNHDHTELFVLLVDERPEEVTDFRRSLTGHGPDDTDRPWDSDRVTVVASSADHEAERHIQVATVTMERCKRLVELGKDVVIILDSLTRLGRAFNRSREYSSSGRTLSGGIDSKALEVPRQLFGAARQTEEAGSLTIIATALIDTGGQGDQVIFEEFKGSGNMELILDRKVAERRLFPAMNLAASGTRKEDLLMPKQELETVNALRRRLLSMPPPQQIEQLLGALKRFETNEDLIGMNRATSSA